MMLAPCPFCGNREPKEPASILGRWLVECGDPCGGAVRDYATAGDAVMAWNRRTVAAFAHPTTYEEIAESRGWTK